MAKTLVFEIPKASLNLTLPPFGAGKCGQPKHKSHPAISSSSGSSVSSFLFLVTFSHLPRSSPPDTRPDPVRRRHSRQVLQQQIRRLLPLGSCRHPLRLKGSLPHRKGLRPHPPSNPRIMDPRFTSQDTDPLPRRHRLHYLVALHQTRQCRD